MIDRLERKKINDQYHILCRLHGMQGMHHLPPGHMPMPKYTKIGEQRYILFNKWGRLAVIDLIDCDSKLCLNHPQINRLIQSEIKITQKQIRQILIEAKTQYELKQQRLQELLQQEWWSSPSIKQLCRQLGAKHLDCHCDNFDSTDGCWSHCKDEIWDQVYNLFDLECLSDLPDQSWSIMDSQINLLVGDIIYNLEDNLNDGIYDDLLEPWQMKKYNRYTALTVPEWQRDGF